MTPERWQEVKAAVCDALEREAGAERNAFLDSRCADDTELRREAESLLAGSTTLIENCANDMRVTRLEENDSTPGRRIGAYRIVEEIGRGGMGAVYLAERADAEFHKQVAIKLLKRGTDTDEVLRRFRSEREILARLEHPNIARLIDGGTTEEGLPYFVMEHVAGTRLNDYCFAQKLTVRERLQLFMKICSAVQFAHQNLVVHRDLKPANILVTPEGEPKLLDFGIAKLLATAAAAYQLTLQDQQRLTPAYASPEQVRGDIITTVSDVYSLGALLYELLVGRPPHRFSAAHPTPTELWRVIGEETPQRPSLAATDKHLARQLRGDLDKILLTALRKEPARRYPGVKAFADDLQRYLEGRPVEARPATAAYRTSKFISRNKPLVAAAALLLLTLLGGIITTAWQAQIARREKARAEERFNEVRKLARSVVFEYYDAIATLPGSTPVREQLVKGALEYLDNLSRDAAADASLLRELATAYHKIGQVQGNSYYSNLGDTEGALKSYRHALEIRERLLAADPDNPELIEEVAHSIAGLGDVLYTIDHLQNALTHYERSRELRERAVASVPENVAYRLALAEVYSKIGDIKGIEGYSNLGDTAGGLASARAAQELLEPLYVKEPQNRDLLSRLSNVLTHVGMLLGTSGDAPGALAVQRRAVEMTERMVAAQPNNQSARSEALAAKHLLRYALEDNGATAEAIEVARSVLTELQTLLAADPKNALFRRNLAITYGALGRNLLAAGDATAALEHQRQSLALLEEMQAGSADRARALQDLGEAQAANGGHRAALESFRNALALREPVLQTNPKNMMARGDVSSLHANLGRTLAALGDLPTALPELESALSLAVEVSSHAPTNARARAKLAMRHADLGRLHLLRDDRDQGRTHLQRSLVLWRELQEKGTLIPAHANEPAEVERQLAESDPERTA